jgi:hypothetical protein
MDSHSDVAPLAERRDDHGMSVGRALKPDMGCRGVGLAAST